MMSTETQNNNGCCGPTKTPSINEGLTEILVEAISSLLIVVPFTFKAAAKNNANITMPISNLIIFFFILFALIEKPVLTCVNLKVNLNVSLNYF